MSGKVYKKKNKKCYGIAINDADYHVQINLPSGKWLCPFYQKWRGMLRRCYDKKYQEKYPTYVGCYVCEEWLTFSNFKSWMEKQDWEGKELDKDLLGRKSKEYSPDTCAFINSETNVFMTNCDKINLSFLKDREVFRVKIGNGKKEKFVGDFKSYEEGINAWINAKSERAKYLAIKETDLRIKDLLLNFKEKINASGNCVAC